MTIAVIVKNRDDALRSRGTVNVVSGGRGVGREREDVSNLLLANACAPLPLGRKRVNQVLIGSSTLYPIKMTVKLLNSSIESTGPTFHEVGEAKVCRSQNEAIPIWVVVPDASMLAVSDRSSEDASGIGSSGPL